jgi:inorganic pyrophosphatase
MLRMLIQVEAGSCDRNVYNEKTLEYIKTSPGSHPYPYPYGFIVGTSAEDGVCVDCYLVTNAKVSAGSIVECEPIGLLEQHEDDEIDHKVLAVLPGEDTNLDPVVLDELQTFIKRIFSGHPEMNVWVGPVHPREAALHHLQEAGSLQPPGTEQVS